MMQDPRRTPPKPKTLTLKAVVELAREHLVRPAWDLIARRAWCRRQRRALGLRRSVVWVRGPAVLWAEWGARRGYFEVQRLNGLSYLSALAAPAA